MKRLSIWLKREWTRLRVQEQLWYPAQSRRYQHRLILSNPVINFTSEKKLKIVVKAISEAEYPPEFEIRKIELPRQDGFMEL